MLPVVSISLLKSISCYVGFFTAKRSSIRPHEAGHLLSYTQGVYYRKMLTLSRGCDSVYASQIHVMKGMLFKYLLFLGAWIFALHYIFFLLVMKQVQNL